MRSLTSASCAAVVAGLLAACSGSGLGSSISTLPNAGPNGPLQPETRPAGVARLHLADRYLPQKKVASLIYASEFSGSQVFGYPNPNSGNNPASCSLGTSSNYLTYVSGFGTDAGGNVIVPGRTPDNSGYDSINVFAPNCGRLIWQAVSTTGILDDAYASRDATTGTVLAVQTLNYTTNEGALVFCSRYAGCGTPFSNSAVTSYGIGTAWAKNGDCWLSGDTRASAPFILVYFKGCKGPGQVATGTSNIDPGGLFFDTKGQLGSIDPGYYHGELYVYKHCDPACTLVSSTALEGHPVYGGLDSTGKHLAVGDPYNNQVEVYGYSPKSGATYSYSFNNGLGNQVEGAQFAPGNKSV